MTNPPDIPEKEIRERCATILSAAAAEAVRLGHTYIGTEHIFIAATRTDSGPTCTLLRRAGLDPRRVRHEIRREIGSGEGGHFEVLPMTPRTEMILSLSIFMSNREESSEVEEVHVLLAMLQEGEGVPIRKLIELGFNVNHWLQKLLTEAYEKDLAGVLNASPSVDEFDASPVLDFDSDEFLSPFTPPRRPNFRPPPVSATPMLDKYGRDLIVQAEQGKIGPAISRDKEIRALARTLARSKKNNPLLLGDAGVGKTAVVEGLAYAIYNKTAPKSLFDKRIFQIEIGTLVAGTSLRGQFEERLIGIVEETRNAGNIILFIDEIHTIVGAGDTIDSNLDAANILKPALARGDIICIGATTHEEYRKAIAKDPALDRRFRPIDIDEPSAEASIQILYGQKERLEDHHGVIISDTTLEVAVRLSIRYLPDRRLPDKAIDLLDEACARVVIQSVSPDESSEETFIVSPANIAAVLSEWTGIPIQELTQDERRRLADIEQTLFKRVVGQDDAVRAVASAIKTARAGLSDPLRPIGVFLFLGPSGVGKTELARALAEFLFGSEDSMLRLDMSEFHDSHTVARLIGAPPGYKDSQSGGQLTDGLRRRPYTVVLLDEVEKAAPEVFDIFLQVFDEGRLSDAHGSVVDARNAVFIMTSNIGTLEESKALGFQKLSERKADYTAHLSRFFRPEFLNRLDDVVTFSALTPESLEKILELQMQELILRLKEQHITLELTPEAHRFILDHGYNPVQGVRPLRRAIEHLITRPLSGRIVEGVFLPGSHIIATVADSELIFEEEANAS